MTEEIKYKRMRSGSVADVFRTMMDELDYGGSYRTYAVDDVYVQHAPVKSSLKSLGLDAPSMAERLGE